MAFVVSGTVIRNFTESPWELLVPHLSDGQFLSFHSAGIISHEPEEGHGRSTLTPAPQLSIRGGTMQCYVVEEGQ